MGDPDDLPHPGWLWVVGRGGQAPLISRFAPVPPGINRLVTADMSQDLYALLGVAPDADAEQISRLG